ncbi:hypothetical protein ACDY97_29625 [Rhizobium mongolense]|uniref:hypothetical protein n=1 Tax=Rhizobium mongolense TaxID=57676 RepID=UPI003557980D
MTQLVLPSLINLTFGRRCRGRTKIPLAAGRTQDDETILDYKHFATVTFGSSTRIRQD